MFHNEKKTQTVDEAFLDFFTNTKRFPLIPTRENTLYAMRRAILNGQKYRETTKISWIQKAGFKVYKESCWEHPKTGEMIYMSNALREVFSSCSLVDLAKKTGISELKINRRKREFVKGVLMTSPERKILESLGYVQKQPFLYYFPTLNK